MSESCLEDAGIEAGTVATLALKARNSNHSARSHPAKEYISQNWDEICENPLGGGGGGGGADEFGFHQQKLENYLIFFK